MPLILGANSVSGYTVKNSLRFNRGSSDSLSRSISSTGNRRINTFSTWVKRSLLATEQRIIMASAGSGSQSWFPAFTGGDFIKIAGDTGTGYAFDLDTTAVFRDPSAWYHIVVAFDTTQATDTNRIKLYVNGTQQTLTGTYPSQNSDMPHINLSGSSFYIGGRTPASDLYFSGYLSEMFWIDGQQLTPSSFGETDFDTGIWKPKAYTGTYGTNGFYLKFANSASLGTDSSGNGNNFTVNNLTSIDQTTDTPTNNFCTLDPLNVPTSSTPTFTEGNTKVVTSSGGNFGGSGNIGASKGKWYFEIKFTSGTTSYGNISLSSSSNARESARQNVHSNQLSSTYPNLCYEYDGNVYKDSSGTSVANYGSYAVGDIVMIAMDLDNQFAYFGRNGTWGNSSVPTSGSSGTGAVSLSTNPDFWHLALGDRNSAGTNTYEVNFGNPPYSANSYTDGAGYGNFSYSVPSGYYSLNTKNLANFG